MAQSPLEQFVIKDIIPLHIGDMDVSFTNSALWMVIGIVVLTTFLLAGARKNALVPGRLQSAAEMFYEFVETMLEENTGPKGRAFFPLVFTIFAIVLMGNVLGLVPYSFTTTSHIIVTGALAVLVFFAVTIGGFVLHGLHFFKLFLPAGAPLILAPIMIPIEVISYLSRPLSLSMRLFANMLAGHTVLKVFAGFSVAFGGALGIGGYVLGIVPAAFNAAIVILEIIVALLQAYIFSLLSCIYLRDAVELH